MHGLWKVNIFHVQLCVVFKRTRQFKIFLLSCAWLMNSIFFMFYSVSFWKNEAIYMYSVVEILGGGGVPPPHHHHLYGKLTNFRKFWPKRGLKTVFSSANGGGCTSEIAATVCIPNIWSMVAYCGLLTSRRIVRLVTSGQIGQIERLVKCLCIMWQTINWVKDKTRIK